MPYGRLLGRLEGAVTWSRLQRRSMSMRGVSLGLVFPIKAEQFAIFMNSVSAGRIVERTLLGRFQFLQPRILNVGHSGDGVPINLPAADWALDWIPAALPDSSLTPDPVAPEGTRRPRLTLLVTTQTGR